MEVAEQLVLGAGFYDLAGLLSLAIPFSRHKAILDPRRAPLGIER